MERDNMILMRGNLTEKAIADVLRSGRADQSFLNALAMMLDPAPGKQPTYRLKLQYGRRERPKGKTYDPPALVADMRELESRGLSRGEEKRERDRILTKHGITARTAQTAVRQADAADRIWDWLEALDREVRR